MYAPQAAYTLFFAASATNGWLELGFFTSFFSRSRNTIGLIDVLSSSSDLKSGFTPNASVTHEQAFPSSAIAAYISSTSLPARGLNTLEHPCGMLPCAVGTVLSAATADRNAAFFFRTSDAESPSAPPGSLASSCQ